MSVTETLLAVSGVLGGNNGGGGGGEAVLINKSVTANGAYNAADDSADGYKKVNVSVANSYAAGDEGKVVHNGALAAQTSDTATSNGTVDTTLINSLTVAVPGITLLSSGVYTKTDAESAQMNIPVTYNGNPTHFLVEPDAPVANVNQTYEWVACLGVGVPSAARPFFSSIIEAVYKTASGNPQKGYPMAAEITNGKILVKQTSSSYKIQPNTYNWYIWGYAT